MKTRFFVLGILLFLQIACHSVVQAQDTTLTNLPCFYITTENGAPVVSRDEYINGALTVAGGSPDSGYYSGDIQIRGRGNSTWDFPKKPYRIKLASKYNLLGMPAKAKSWVLLANYADKTLMRDALAFEVSKFFGFTYTPAYRMADVVLNGDYIGTYTITDQIEQGKNRVDVEDQDEDDSTLPAISGGYLIQTGGQAREDTPHYTTSRGMDWEIKYPDDPDDINPQQKNYIVNYVQQFENSLFSPDFKDPVTGYRKYANIKSLADGYLLNELCANSDSYWSNYMYKHRDDSALYTGPMWDYDIAFDNDSRLGDESYLYMRDKAFEPKVWISQLLQDEGFFQTVRSRWFELKKAGVVQRMQKVTDSLARVLNESQKLNFQRWPILNQIVYLELAARGSYRNEVNFLKNFVNVHSGWLNREFTGFDSAQNYTITSLQTGKVWDILNSSKADGSGLVQFARTPQKSSQKWKAVNLNNGYYRMVNVNSGKVITNNGSLVQEDKLYQTTYVAGSLEQQWRIINTGSHFGIINRYSGQAADNFGSITTNNNPVTQFGEDIYSRVNQFYNFTLSPVVKLNSDTASVHFALYPNPVTGSTIVIRLQLAAAADVNLFIYNAQGLPVKQINKGKLEKGNNNIDISAAGLHTGHYTITVNANGESSSQLLLVK